MYRIVLSTATGPFYGALLLRRPGPAPVALIASTHSWDTYNGFGGLSNYADRQAPFGLRHASVFARILRVRVPDLGDAYPIIPLPRARVNTRLHEELAGELRDPDDRFSAHLARAEWPVVAWFERQGIDSAVFAQDDWDEGRVPADIRLAVFHAHSEYWTRAGVARLEAAIAAGVSVLFLSGNNLWQWLEPYDGGLRVGRLIDPSFGRQLIGTAYHRMSTETFAPYRVRWAGHPLFKGLPVRSDTIWGEHSSNDLGAPRGRGAASAHEIDVMGPGSEGFELLAQGRNAPWGADLVHRRTPAGGLVVNVSSTGFSGCMLHDPVASGLVSNVVAAALAVR
jgi:hypothetical protein